MTGQREDEEQKETNDDTTQSEGCHIKTMLGYVNDGVNYVSTEESQKKFEGNTVTQMLFKGETDSEKEERMAVIGQSLIISCLEDDLEEILKTKIAVKDTEDRIYRLQQVIQLLKGFEIKEKHDTEEDEVEKKDLKEEENLKVEKNVKESDVNNKETKEQKDSQIETECMVDGQIDENVMKEDNKEEEIHGDVGNADEETEKIDMATEYVKSDEMSTKKGMIVLDRS